MKLLFSGVCCLLIVQIVFGLNEEPVKEKPCIKSPPPPVAKNVDFSWVLQVEEWYFPHFSKLDLYRTASEVRASPISEMQEDELYYDACLTMKSGSAGVSTLFGFQGKRTEFKLTAMSENVFKFATNSEAEGMSLAEMFRQSKTSCEIYFSRHDNLDVLELALFQN